MLVDLGRNDVGKVGATGKLGDLVCRGGWERPWRASYEWLCTLEGAWATLLAGWDFAGCRFRQIYLVMMASDAPLSAPAHATRCRVAGSVKVDALMEVERYSHVMHISSTVTGKLLPELNAWDVMRAALPAGTVSGAPKASRCAPSRKFGSIGLACSQKG